MKLSSVSITLSTVLSFGAVVALSTALMAAPCEVLASGPHHNATSSPLYTTIVKNAIRRANHAGKTAVSVTLPKKISNETIRTVLEISMRGVYPGMNPKATKKGSKWDARGMYQNELKRHQFTISFK